MQESYKEDNRPSFQFYPDDWQRDTGLRLCSLETRGLWIEMLCIMWYGKPRGTLTVNGRQLDNKGLAKIMSESKDVIDKLITELEHNGVFSRLSDGTIYCRRMYREWQKVEHTKKARSRAGKKGMASRWGADNKNVTKITTSTSSSSSTSNSLNNNFDNNKTDGKSRSGRSDIRHISKIIPDALKAMKQSISNMSNSKLKKVLEKKASEIEANDTANEVNNNE